MFDLAPIPSTTALSRLTNCVAAARDAAAAGSAQERSDAVSTMLSAIDQLYAGVLSLIDGNGIAAVSGLPTEMFLMFDGRVAPWEAHGLTQAAADLRGMPLLKDAFDRRLVSWSQVRAILRDIKVLRVEDRAAVDALIGEKAPRHTEADPERLIVLVHDEVARRRDDLQSTRENRAFETRSLWMQAGLDGSGVLVAHGDVVSLESVHQALTARADSPEADVPRGRQMFDALVDIAEESLAGGTGLRPRPRLLATFDIAGLTDDAKDHGMRLLSALAGGRPLRMTRVTRDELVCDATVVPIITDNGRPIEVGDEFKTFSNKTRNAILARDRRCRCCGRPATLFDVHHINPGSGGQAAEDGVLLCRRCHRLVHTKGWRLRWLDCGELEFRRRGRRFISPP